MTIVGWSRLLCSTWVCPSPNTVVACLPACPVPVIAYQPHRLTHYYSSLILEAMLIDGRHFYSGCYGPPSTLDYAVVVSLLLLLLSPEASGWLKSTQRDTST